MSWTTAQQKAIELRNKNILVSAAAGSGKTAVLVERIKRLIIEEDVSLDEMLIVTFTNAAASEMKEKISNAINKAIVDDPNNSKHLRKQINILGRANICTFHAFSLEVIRKYFYIIDIEPNFNICDETEQSIIQGEALDELIENLFETEFENFSEFLNCYSSSKNESAFREIVSNIYKTLQSLPEPWDWLNEKIEELNQTPKEFENGKIMDFVFEYAINQLKSSISILKNVINQIKSDKLEIAKLAILGIKDDVDTLLTAAQNKKIKALKECMENLELPKVVKPKKIILSDEDLKCFSLMQNTVKQVKSIIKNLDIMIFSQSQEEHAQDLNWTYSKMKYLQEILKKYDALYKAKKTEKNLIDFNDIEHYALEILKDDAAAKTFRDKFKYIFVDEYQDSNLIQEALITKIKRENNLFMVGDIKQSIYKFRLAEPEIFKKKYNLFANCSDGTSEKIDLNKNFRSKSKILGSINGIFGEIMEDYDDAAALYEGLNYSGDYNYSPEFSVILTSPSDSDATEDEIDNEIKDMKNSEKEALLVATKIKKLVGVSYFDAKANENKVFQLKDIVILMRSVKNYADIFYRILKSQGVNAYIDDNDGYFDTIEINVFMNLLSVINNKRQDIPLLSVLHSEIFDFSMTELAEVRLIDKKGPFYDDFIKYASLGDSHGLKEKCQNVLNKFTEWCNLANVITIDELIWKLLIDTGYYLKIGAIPGGKQRQVNLCALVDKGLDFGDKQEASLYDFIKYIDSLKKRKVQTSQVKLIGENENLVRIMSIHKSKGLEFPAVIVAGLGKNLNYTKGGSGISIHKDFGIGAAVVDYNKHTYKRTILQSIIDKQVHIEEYEENLRIMYVAMTRAKEKLILTGYEKGEKDEFDEMTYLPDNDKKYISILNGPYLRNKNVCGNHETIAAKDLDYISNQNGASNKENIIVEQNYFEISEHIENKELADEVVNRLSYVYPYKKSLSVKSRYSVSEINQVAGNRYKKSLAVPNFSQIKRNITSSEKGNIYHEIMEHIDFQEASENGILYIKNALETFIKEDIFLREEIDAIDISKIADFFQESLGKRAVAAQSRNELFKEAPFNLVKTFEGEDVIVQGIIDCFFKEGDGWILLDYKTNYIDKSKNRAEELERIKAAYIEQLKIYKEALEVSKNEKVTESYLYLFDVGEQIKL